MNCGNSCNKEIEPKCCCEDTCCQKSGIGPAIMIVLFILLVIIIGARFC